MQLLLQWQSSNDWMKCSDFHEQHLNPIGETLAEKRKRGVDFCFLNPSRNHSRLSTSCSMSRNIAPYFVYQRKKHCFSSVFVSPVDQSAAIRPADGCNSAISSEFVSRYCTEATRSIPDECNGVGERCINGSLSGHEAVSPNARAAKANDFSVIDNCSSSRSNLKHSSTSLEVHDGGECSSSGALLVGKSLEMSEKDICIGILRSQGLLYKTWRVKERSLTGRSESSSDYYCLKSCKICERRDSTRNMLICDTCDDAIHRSCCTPRVKILPVGEWLCSSCSKKKRAILKNKCTDDDENGRNGFSVSDTEEGSLGYLLRNSEPYMSNVRIGDKYQADVPVWHGLDNEVYDPPIVPLEMNSSNIINLPETNSFRPVKLCSIGNWIQCQESIDCTGERSDRAICGKWRRAPLFEVQTDNWECFRCILWDPAHADCSVPQEVETEEIMKQLKYIQMLRPRLTAKRRKMNNSKHNAAKETLQ